MIYEKLPSKEELWLHGCARTTEAIRSSEQIKPVKPGEKLHCLVIFEYNFVQKFGCFTEDLHNLAR